MTIKVKAAIIFADESRGIYIPKHFAENYVPDKWLYIDQSDIDILLQGPEHEHYGDAWETILSNAETIDGRVLHHDGSLFVIDAQGAIDAINEHCEQQLDYAESHKDAGDSYAHMPSEGDSTDQMNRLAEFLKAHDITVTDSELDSLHDYCLDWFEMTSAHNYEFQSDSIFEIASYPISEIEIDISCLGIDGITLDYVSNSVDGHMNHDHTYVYLASDYSWRAVMMLSQIKEGLEYIRES